MCTTRLQMCFNFENKGLQQAQQAQQALRQAKSQMSTNPPYTHSECLLLIQAATTGVSGHSRHSNRHSSRWAYTLHAHTQTASCSTRLLLQASAGATGTAGTAAGTGSNNTKLSKGQRARRNKANQAAAAAAEAKPAEKGLDERVRAAVTTQEEMQVASL